MEELGDAKLADTTEYLDELVLDYRPFSTSSHTSTVLEASPRRAAQTRVVTPQAPKRRRLNPKAAWPYVIGITIFALEAFFIVSG
jgi:hyaluronan synthase